MTIRICFIVSFLHLNFQPLKYKIAISHDSKDYYEQYRSQTLFGDDVLPIKLGMEEMPTIDSESEDRSPEGGL